jgi:hypothetical protein
MAECSLSIGSSVAPPCCTACMKSAPPTTSASLLASISRLPARAAAMHGARPAAPTMAAITASTSGCAARSHSACAPVVTSVRRPCSASAVRSSRACASPGTATTRGLNCTHWAISSGSRRLPLRPKTSNCPGWRLMTSSVLVPTEPVEPRIATRCGRFMQTSPCFGVTR